MSRSFFDTSIYRRWDLDFREDLVGDSFRERLTLDIALYQDYFDCIAAIDCRLMSL